MTDDDAKLNRASMLNAGAVTAITALLAAAGCSGKNGNGSSSSTGGTQQSDPANPTPQASYITHPVHIFAQFPLGANGMGTPSANATTCTIVICDATTAPPALPNGATKIFAANSPSAMSNGDSCDSSGAVQQQQSVLIYVT